MDCDVIGWGFYHGSDPRNHIGCAGKKTAQFALKAAILLLDVQGKTEYAAR